MSAQNLDRLIQHAETAMFQAELVGPAGRDELLTEAKDTLIRAEMLAPGRGAWLLACVNARLGNAQLAQKWLERAHKSGGLPARTKVASSAYMISVREQTWFKEFVTRLG